jgi:hypothetical protein
MKKLLFIVLLLSLALAACGGGSSSGPVDAAKNLVKALEKLDIEEGNKYLCEAQQMDATEGADAAMLEAFEVKTSNMKYEEKSKDGDKAVVSISGKVSLEIDEDKLKELVKEEAAAAGEEVTDEELDFYVGMLTGMSGEQVEFEQDVEVVKEDGDWVVCDELTILDEVAPDF